MPSYDSPLPTPSPRFLVSDLLETLETYLSAEQQRAVYSAYLFAAEAHDGQWRQSGEAYIFHPLAVAKILADMRLDYQTLMAALLHDVIEDTPTAKEQLAQQFGPEVAHLVDGVSKLDKVKFSSRAESEASNFQKMFLAMAQDIRVILVKLADRLHNMRTLSAMKPASARRKAHETLEIYAPIAQRLGIACLHWELEHWCFLTLYPWRYQIINRAIRRTQMQRTERIQQIISLIQQRLQAHDLPALVTLESLRVFAVYRKAHLQMDTLHTSLNQIELKIVVKSRQLGDCYRAIGILHASYKPIPGHLKDYIAIPKTNGYQALHTLLACSEKLNILARIQNSEMEQVAQMGIAAHWCYNMPIHPSGHTSYYRAEKWINGLLELQKNIGDSQEFIENVKMDLFPDEVYVVTPKGEIITLPRGATPVDLAYAIHTDIGNTCIGAKVDNRRVHLLKPLLNGQSVQILTDPKARPSPDWLNFVVTGKARTQIKLYFKNTPKLDQGNLAQVSLHPTSLAIKSTDGLAVSFAACCHPIPDDAIAGIFSPGLGMVVHLANCPHLLASPQCWPMEWSSTTQTEFPVEIWVKVEEKLGVLALVSAAIAEQQCNIEQILIEMQPDNTRLLKLVISVRNRLHLADVLREIKTLAAVKSVSRSNTNLLPTLATPYKPQRARPRRLPHPL